MCKPVEGYCQSAVSGPGAKTTEVEACMALVCVSTNDSRPLTGGTNLIWTVVNWFASGSEPYINGTHRNLAHGLVKA